MLVPIPVNLAERALTSAKAAELTTETRGKVAAAIEAPADERETLLIDALASAVGALDALTALLLAREAETNA
jgi:hypothetical protein